MKHLRKHLINWLFEHSQRVYTQLFKTQAPWDMTTQQLLTYPKDTFGFQLGKFLHNNNFELIPKVERHDCYHVLCGYGTKVEDEIALQYLCYGNGKRSLYLYGVLILGTLILPEYSTYYYNSYKIGKTSNAFHHFDYQTLLHVNFEDLRQIIFSTTYSYSLNN